MAMMHYSRSNVELSTCGSVQRVSSLEHFGFSGLDLLHLCVLENKTHSVEFFRLI